MKKLLFVTIALCASTMSAYAAPGDVTVISPALAFGRISTAGAATMMATKNRDTLKIAASGSVSLTTDPVTKTLNIVGAPLGTATTAIALAANGANCSAGQAAPGVDASGASEGCFAVQSPLIAGTDYLTPAGSAAALTGFPTLNQNTTGSAAKLTTPRTINGVSFDGTADITIYAVAAWSTPTLINAWANYGSAQMDAGYHKDPFGVVRVRGLVKSGTTGTAIFTLPAGHRPTAAMRFIARSGSGLALVDVDALGDVSVYAYISPGSNSDVDLSGISFLP